MILPFKNKDSVFVQRFLYFDYLREACFLCSVNETDFNKVVDGLSRITKIRLVDITSTDDSLSQEYQYENYLGDWVTFGFILMKTINNHY